MTPGVVDIFDPRGKIGRIYVELHMTLLYIKYTSFVTCCCREDFFIYFHYKSMVDNDMPGRGLYGPQGYRWICFF